ncbi:unnamed protein product [Brachionus calyciflorus]|uniref:HAT C-terminal dimerisation domain-containing protein n=1 Tax=Brachionus calyciflorus TaxID=104777 RepID=A0A814Q6L7_9BILA|nr:unnamed protein product [Brachionus calyciflorus]
MKVFKLNFNRQALVLLDTIYLDVTNFKTVSQAVIKTLNKYGIVFENVYAYVTDNASYMNKSYKSVLDNLLPNCRHVTCVAHIVALIADTWRKSPARRIRYKTFLQEMHVEKPLLPPEPVITRWNTWFKAVQYHYENWANLLTFFGDENRIFSESESMNDALDLLNNVDVKNDAKFIVENCERFMVLQVKYQANNALATELYNDLMDLNFWHIANIEKHENDQQKLVLFESSHKKLKKYLFGGDMPAMDLFKASRILVPKQFKTMDNDLKDYSELIPELKSCNAEWLVYKEIVREANFTTNFDRNEFWLSNKKRIPILFEISKWFLYYPTNSAVCERSISVYNKIITDDRNRLSKETLTCLNFITFNNKRSLKKSLEVKESDFCGEPEIIELDNFE